ncbi:unnamed protein product [Protopolystoma xenopodis]|uniref:Uncharacterized protein n=1 Tax=Protopolystoma xenopodis TaxID=117903 RepID=A0A448X5A8_9PLAT|nr:unnamed protein product [Protopolystoma xenopodis]
MHRTLVFVTFEKPLESQLAIENENGVTFAGSIVTLRKFEDWDPMISGDLILTYHVPDVIISDSQPVKKPGKSANSSDTENSEESQERRAKKLKSEDVTL